MNGTAPGYGHRDPASAKVKIGDSNERDCTWLGTS
jgi:hypothetical protein